MAKYLLALLLALASLPAFGAAGDAAPAKAGGWTSMDDLATARWAVFTGTVHDGWVAKNYPKAQIVRFNSTADFIIALKAGKVDLALMDLVSSGPVLKANPGIGVIADNFFNTPLGIGFRKEDNALRENFNRFLQSIRSDGTYDDMRRRWILGDPEEAKVPELPAVRGGRKITLGVSVADLPYVAWVNEAYVGFDIELLKRFASRENLDMRIITLEFDSLIAALTSRKVDIITDGISITEERSRTISFSDPYMEFRSVALAMSANLAPGADLRGRTAPAATAIQAAAPAASAAPGAASPQGGAQKPDRGLFARIGDSFVRNIVVENRWRLILRGLRSTVVISVLSTLFGTLVGALVCWMRMSGRNLPKAAAAAFVSVLRGMPVLVILMLIFYVAFASVNIDPILVAVLAFGLNFGAYVSEMFRTGIEGVEKGQSEAGIALGFTGAQSFAHIILPQATRRILPVYRGEFISLVKTTSIVGYIGVEDLTKAGDIIRSRTFDAFFPLVMVAVIYYAVTLVLGLLLDWIDRRTDPVARRASRVPAARAVPATARSAHAAARAGRDSK